VPKTPILHTQGENMSYKVAVYRADPAEAGGYFDAVGYVKANNKLDTWDGSNMTFRGATGEHAGITKLRRTIDGKRFVLIRTTQWSGGRDYAYLITDDEARSLLIETGNKELLKKWFPNFNPDIGEDDA